MSDQLALLEQNVDDLRGHSETLSNHVLRYFSDDDPAPAARTDDAALPVRPRA